MRNTGQYAILDTDRGTIVIELYPAVAPKTVANFEKLSKKGFYDNLTFHRVEPGFVVQGGDPQGNGMGGPGYDLPAEISPTEKHLRGTLAMARKGDQVNPDRKSSGSQFYICLAPAPFLDSSTRFLAAWSKGWMWSIRSKSATISKRSLLATSCRSSSANGKSCTEAGTLAGPYFTIDLHLHTNRGSADSNLSHKDWSIAPAPSGSARYASPSTTTSGICKEIEPLTE